MGGRTKEGSENKKKRSKNSIFFYISTCRCQTKNKLVCFSDYSILTYPTYLINNLFLFLQLNNVMKSGENKANLRNIRGCLLNKVKILFMLKLKHLLFPRHGDMDKIEHFQNMRYAFVVSQYRLIYSKNERYTLLE